MNNNNENTLEIHKLIIGNDEIEAEATDSVSEYLLTRTAFHANKLGKNHYKIVEFDVVKDAMSNGWVLVFMCERWF